MKWTNKLLIALAFCVPTQAWPQGDPEGGKAHYVTCVACHGASAQGNRALNAPRLNHLSEVYLVAQLEKFQQGHRGGADGSALAKQMAPMAATLSDSAAIANVSAYITTLTGGPTEASVEGDATLGGDFYNQLCGACHGAQAEGNLALNSPRLAGTDDWYLLEQLRAFRAGERGAHADDKTGKQMQAMAMAIPSDAMMANVVAFLRGLEP